METRLEEDEHTIAAVPEDFLSDHMQNQLLEVRLTLIWLVKPLMLQKCSCR